MNVRGICVPTSHDTNTTKMTYTEHACKNAAITAREGIKHVHIHALQIQRTSRAALVESDSAGRMERLRADILQVHNTSRHAVLCFQCKQ
jgi:hypothetical protein